MTTMFPFWFFQSLKMSKRDAVSVHIKWFYRTSEVPEQVYQLLIQDRHTEHHGTTAPTRSKVDIAAMNDPIYRTRELFISEKTETKPYSVSMLRGKCKVHHCLDIRYGWGGVAKCSWGEDVKKRKKSVDLLLYVLRVQGGEGVRAGGRHLLLHPVVQL